MTIHVVVDLGFGDSGKGTITDFLVRDTGARLVVRWNGGAQAGHTVVTDDGRAHTFSQLGAGTFLPGVRTHLAETVVVHPTALLVEARHLARAGVSDALSRLTIAESARLITPFHQSANRLRELARGARRHGSCGVGVGEAVRDALAHPEHAIRARDLGDADRLMARLRETRARIVASLRDELAIVGPHPEREVLESREVLERWCGAARELAPHVVPDAALGALLRSHGDVVLEGAQGVLLDERFGFHPHTTWSDCTASAALRLLDAHHAPGPVERIGVLRAYLTRHGEGPFPTEDRALVTRLPELHNESSGWQGAFRVGAPDLVLARYAARVSGGVDGLALTHLDRAPAIERIATHYDAHDPELFVSGDRGAIDLREGELAHQARLAGALRDVRVGYAAITPDELERALAAAIGAPLVLRSFGPAARAKERV